MSDSLLHKMMGQVAAQPPAPPPVPPEPPRRASVHGGGRFERWHMQVPPSQEEENWVVSYMDMVTALLAMLVVMLAFAGPSKVKPKGDTPPAVNAQTHANTAPALTSVVPPLPVPVPKTEPATRSASEAKPQETPKDPVAQALAGLPLQALGSNIQVQVNKRSVSFRISSELLFGSGDASLTPGGQQVVDRLLVVVNKLPDYTIVVEGHTDNQPIQTPRFPSNWELAAARAGSVVRHLQNRGLNPTRLRATGYADTHPLESNATAEGRATNRRVEITLEAPP